MSHTDPLQVLREEINHTSPRGRRILALALRESDQDILIALAVGLLNVNRDDEQFLGRADYELTKIPREQVDAIAATLPPPPAPTGIERRFDPETGQFLDDQEFRSDE